MGINVVDRISLLLAQHKEIQTSFAGLEDLVNDWESASQLKALRKEIDSERLAVGPWPMALEQDVSRIETQLNDHFDREEDILAECVQISEDPGLLATLNRLRSDHQEIITRIGDLRAEARQIALALTSRSDWIGRAFGVRVHITNTRVLLEKHAEEEEGLFKMLEGRLSAHGR